jgi:SAM-dependent methyltransferase
LSYRELLIGCGNDRAKKVRIKDMPDEWASLTTLDIDPSTKPDVVHDLNVLPYPFEDGAFDEIHAYEVLEHCGRQGDWKFFFDQFNEFYRMLKPGGMFVASVPMWDSMWAWGDPGHVRVICKGSLFFLRKAEYEQLGKTSMTDYRQWLNCDFETLAINESEHNFGFILRALK